MTKRMITLLAAMLLALGMMAGPAMAEGHGNNGVLCSISGELVPDAELGDDNVVRNPAAMFKYYSDRGNPVDAIGESGTGWTVGEWIQNRCGQR